MNRRLFLKKSVSGIILLATAPTLISCFDKKNVRFGIITDLHYSQCPSYGTRYFSQTMSKLKTALDVFNGSNLDFLIELGDFKDQDTEPQRETTLLYLDEIEKLYQSFQGPVYHVLGNHDMDSISKEEFLLHTSNYGNADKKSYYSYIVNNIKFIVLDANYNENGTAYNSGNFTWTNAYISPEQIDWLRDELADKRFPILVFVHQMLDYFSDIHPSLCVNNAEEIVPLLEDNGKVLAVFQGHHHPGHYSFRNNIHYWTMKGMIEGSLPENNSFAKVEIDTDYNIHIEGFYNCEDRILT